jgi:D-arabinose 1-dehydrogenase-like Zn-dependent alcohol dehydrogenase
MRDVSRTGSKSTLLQVDERIRWIGAPRSLSGLHDCRFSFLCEAARSAELVSAARLTCAGATSWRALTVSGAQKDDWIGIVRSGGGLEHLAVQFAVAKGLNVVAIDAKDAGLELTKTAGAQVVLDARSGKEDVVRQVKENWWVREDQYRFVRC